MKQILEMGKLTRKELDNMWAHFKKIDRTGQGFISQVLLGRHSSGHELHRTVRQATAS